MKPIFCIDIAQNKKNDSFNGNEFITATVSKKNSEALELKQEELEKTVEQSQLPLWMRIVKMICGIAGVIIGVSTVRASTSIGFAKAFSNAPILISTGFLCLVAWLILQFLSKKKERAVLTANNAEQQAEAIESDIKSIYDCLNVPSDATSVDVLVFRYKMKDGMPSAQTVGFQLTPYLNLDLKIYENNDELCLADLDNVYSFKKSEFKSIKTVDKRISVPSWNKGEQPTKGIFKQYKMTVNNMGCVFFKPYYILELEHDGELCGIYFPCYELETFEKLTGLHAE